MCVQNGTRLIADSANLIYFLPFAPLPNLQSNLTRERILMVWRFISLSCRMVVILDGWTVHTVRSAKPIAPFVYSRLLEHQVKIAHTKQTLVSARSANPASSQCSSQFLESFSFPIESFCWTPFSSSVSPASDSSFYCGKPRTSRWSDGCCGREPDEPGSWSVASLSECAARNASSADSRSPAQEIGGLNENRLVFLNFKTQLKTFNLKVKTRV